MKHIILVSVMQIVQYLVSAQQVSQLLVSVMKQTQLQVSEMKNTHLLLCSRSIPLLKLSRNVINFFYCKLNFTGCLSLVVVVVAN